MGEYDPETDKCDSTDCPVHGQGHTTGEAAQMGQDFLARVAADHNESTVMALVDYLPLSVAMVLAENQFGSNPTLLAATILRLVVRGVREIDEDSEERDAFETLLGDTKV